MTSVQKTTNNTETFPFSVSRGTKVVVNTFGGGQKECVVWDAIGDFVYVVNERYVQALSEGSECPTPIGFHKTAVIVQ